MQTIIPRLCCPLLTHRNKCVLIILLYEALTAHGIEESCSSAAFSDTSAKCIRAVKTVREEANTRHTIGEIRFPSVMYLLFIRIIAVWYFCGCSCRRVKRIIYVPSLRVFLCCWLSTSNSRKHLVVSRVWMSTTGLLPGTPDTLTQPMGACFNFVGGGFLRKVLLS